mmetsp:Transcript_3972/g.12603  ORF Transcript_3972/g.12603 Transcript_3972/m.12603 type:complete len:308 (+) Transcript_3972:982-1905(+)
MLKRLAWRHTVGFDLRWRIGLRQFRPTAYDEPLNRSVVARSDQFAQVKTVVKPRTRGSDGVELRFGTQLNGLTCVIEEDDVVRAHHGLEEHQDVLRGTIGARDRFDERGHEELRHLDFRVRGDLRKVVREPRVAVVRLQVVPVEVLPLPLLLECGDTLGKVCPAEIVGGFMARAVRVQLIVDLVFHDRVAKTVRKKVPQNRREELPWVWMTSADKNTRSVHGAEMDHRRGIRYEAHGPRELVDLQDTFEGWHVECTEWIGSRQCAEIACLCNELVRRAHVSNRDWQVNGVQHLQAPVFCRHRVGDVP